MKTTEKLISEVKMVNPELRGTDKFNMKIEVPIPKLDKDVTIRFEVNAESETISSVAAQEKLTELAKENIKTFVNGLGMLVDMSLEKLQKAYELKQALDAKEKEKEDNKLPYWWENSSEFDGFISMLDNGKKVLPDEIDKWLKEAEEKSDYDVTRSLKWVKAQINKAKFGELNKAQLESLRKYIYEI